MRSNKVRVAQFHERKNFQNWRGFAPVQTVTKKEKKSQQLSFGIFSFRFVPCLLFLFLFSPPFFFFFLFFLFFFSQHSLLLPSTRPREAQDPDRRGNKFAGQLSWVGADTSVAVVLPRNPTKDLTLKWAASSSSLHLSLTEVTHSPHHSRRGGHSSPPPPPPHTHLHHHCHHHALPAFPQRHRGPRHSG